MSMIILMQGIYLSFSRFSTVRLILEVFGAGYF